MPVSITIRIQTWKNLIKNIEESIEILEAVIFRFAYKSHNRELKPIMSSPSAGKISTVTSAVSLYTNI